MVEEIYTPDADLGTTVRAKVIELRHLDRKLAAKKTSEPIVEIFARQCRERRLPEPAMEFEFATRLNRKWKFDFAWVMRGEKGAPMYKLAVEIEGIVMRRTKSGEWIMGGRHATIGGFKEDNIKYATAAMLGWRLMRFEQSQVKSNFAISMVMRALARNGWRPK